MLDLRFACRATALLACLALLGASAARAEPPPDQRAWNPSCHTLQRSAQNIVMSPADAVMSPFVAAQSVVVNIRDIDDTMPVRIFYPVPGYLWNTMVQLGSSVIRGITGVIEFVPGVILCPFEAELDPLFDPAEENDALVDWENGYFNVKFGVNYTTAG